MFRAKEISKNSRISKKRKIGIRKIRKFERNGSRCLFEINEFISGIKKEKKGIG